MEQNIDEWRNTWKDRQINELIEGITEHHIDR